MAVHFQILSVLVLAAALAHSQSILALKARFFDHDYGDFNGEFSATKVGCSFDFKRMVTGMVLDTLSFDPAKGKKIPRRGPVDLCSKSLEKWFDPSESRSTSCGNLFLRNSGTPEKPLWKFDETSFFPMDGLSRQRTWSLPDGGALANDFAYCM
ncbi:MAG: hypothetical protein M3Y08_01075, partial [Fibrobacterota bacterium]|nr:hypothetical protein [Fibrobacterota bacterium]